jgi:hypothetical protein
MDEREALERLAAVDHAAYVLERAEAVIDACETKLEKAHAHVTAAEDAKEAAYAAVEAAEEEYESACQAAGEVPPELRAHVARMRPEITAAHAETADASGGAN